MDNTAARMPFDMTLGECGGSTLPVRESQWEEFSTLGSGNPIKRKAETLHPVWALDINEQRHPVEKPITLRVAKEGDKYFAENDYFDICAYGDTPSEALESAIVDIVYYQKHYSGLHENEVVGYGATLRQRYMALLT